MTLRVTTHDENVGSRLWSPPSQRFDKMRRVSTEDGLTWCFQARIRVCLGQPRGTTHCSFEDAEQFHQTQAVRLTFLTTRHESRHAGSSRNPLACSAKCHRRCVWSQPYPFLSAVLFSEQLHSIALTTSRVISDKDLYGNGSAGACQ